MLAMTNQDRNQLLFETNPHPMWIFDRQSLQFLAVNDAAVAQYGFSREEFLTMTIRQIRPPEQIPVLLEHLARVTEGASQFWTCHRRKDGSLLEVEIHAHNIDFNQRRARVVMAHDLTQNRRAQERLRLDAAALMSTRDAILIIDRTPSILSVNPAFTAMTGYSEAEILGKDPCLLGSIRHGRVFSRKLWAALLEQGAWQGEILGCRKDGATFPGWLSASTVYDDEGRPAHFVGVMTDLTKLKRSEERLQYLANYDSLTDLPRRHLLESVLQHALERALRERNQVALLVVDLDQFKVVNESFGHEVGDELLVAVVQRLRSQVRRENALSRLAGNQFALVLEGVQDYTRVETVARKLLALMEPSFLLREKHQVYLRASIGISLFPQDGALAQTLLRSADAAVNQAKKQGGNQFCYSTPELNNQARQRLELQVDLRRALEQGEFVLHYQPKVDLRSGRVVGAEALLRWESPSRGMVPPLQFIPEAEKSGLIVPLGTWVLEKVCAQIRSWREQNLLQAKVAVNVSALQFRRGNLESVVAAALQRHDLEADCLLLELTESMLMDNPEEAIERMQGLRRLGVQLALDDFGTGYSSLGYLSRFPIDQLKIDRSFITNIVTDPNAATIANSVIALAHRMRLRVVAEGVETKPQLDFLRQNDCDEMQGYYFSKPLPAAEFAALLAEGRALTELLAAKVRSSRSPSPGPSGPWQYPAR